MFELAIFIICIALISLMILGVVCVRNLEKKRWNGGYCPYCGLKWIHYDTDSQGGRMYRCDNWHYCDVSYNVDK